MTSRRQRGFMGRAITVATLLVIAGVIWLSLSWYLDSRPVDYGAPTPLAADAPLRSAVCAIRDEVAALDEPLVRRHRFHEQWTETRFAAGRFTYGPFHQIIPSDEVRALVRRHTRAELIAALSPLLADLEQGGAAAVVLASLPVPRKASLGRTSALAGAVKEAQGGRAEVPVRWDPRRGRALIDSLIGNYGLINVGRRVERAAGFPDAETFETRLETILEDAADLPLQFIAPRPEPRARYEQVQDLLAAEPVPAADEVFAEFLAAHAPEDLLIALLPMQGTSGNVGGGYAAMLIWGTGRADRYWPLAATATFDRRTLGDALLDELLADALAMCDSDQALEAAGSGAEARGRLLGRAHAVLGD